MSDTSSRTSKWLFIGGGLAGLAVAAAISRTLKLRSVAPALRSRALAFMPPIIGPMLPLVREAGRKAAARAQAPDGIAVRENHIPREDGSAVRVLELRRSQRAATAPAPAIVWLHGGGHVMGTPEMEMPLLARIIASLDIVILSVDYRLSPRDPFPAALNDAADTLNWVKDQGSRIGVDPARVAVGGNSAGGGLAAALAQRAHDRGIAVAFQLLMYPMIDDRTAIPRDHGGRGELVWTPRNNRVGWGAYLASLPRDRAPPPYASPARRDDLTGLAPAWIGVGTLDLFYEEDITYADRLRAADVACTLSVVEGAPHIFDVLSFDTAVARQFHENMIEALSEALRTERAEPSGTRNAL